MGVSTRAQHACFGGVQGFHSHRSQQTGLDMGFSLFLPPQARAARVPVLVYLAGLTCTEETFPIKAGAQRLAAELGLALAAPDTSPRGAGALGEDRDWDLGLGAGFYVDATREPWQAHYRMYSYVTRELPRVLAENFPIDPTRQGIFGHSMGGHGALVCALREPGQYRSVSAFAPICAPSRCPWGEKAFAAYLGEDRADWARFDATELVRTQAFPGTILLDQGSADRFLAEQLHPNAFAQACAASGQQLDLRWQEGYDHGYFFIMSFLEDHLRHHARALQA